MDQFGCLFCQSTYPGDPYSTFCPQCREPLLLHSGQEKKTIHSEKSNSLERYLDFLPLSTIETPLLLGQRETPLIPLYRLKKEFTLPQVFVKNETVNPTGSFKDRGTVVAVQNSVQFGITKIGTVSTGNMASSTAAFGARAGLKTIVLVKEDTALEKIIATSIYNPILIKVRGDYGRLFYGSLELGKKLNIRFMNSVDPYRIEGYKITSFEIHEQLRPHAPQYVIAPVSSGGHIIGLMKAFIELQTHGLIEQMPKFIGVQAEGCSPITQAFKAQKDRVERIEKAETIAHAISNPDPPGGNLLLKLMREYGGEMMTVDDPEILSAQKTLAEYEGIFCQPASATTLAALLKLNKKNALSAEDRIVLIITGTGLKSLPKNGALSARIHQTDVDHLEQTLSFLDA
jgi:threonine synthase